MKTGKGNAENAEIFACIRFAAARLRASAILTAPSIADAQLNTLTDGNDGTLPTPPGLYVTPTAPLTGAIQQPLNPGPQIIRPSSPQEAVKAVVSPDGTISRNPDRALAFQNSPR